MGSSSSFIAELVLTIQDCCLPTMACMLPHNKSSCKRQVTLALGVAHEQWTYSNQLSRLEAMVGDCCRCHLSLLASGHVDDEACVQHLQEGARFWAWRCRCCSLL